LHLIQGPNSNHMEARDREVMDDIRPSAVLMTVQCYPVNAVLLEPLTVAQGLKQLV